MNIYEQILAGLKTKFQGVEDATLQRIASKKAEKTAVSNYEKKHNIKDGKPIEEPKPQPTPTPTPQPKPVEEVPAWAQSLIDSNKTLSERLASMDAKTKADARNAQIEEVAKSFGIPEFAYKGKTIADDADLSRYFTDLKQEMQNSGFQFAKSPEEGNHEHKTEVNSIAEQINKGTQEIVEQNKK